MDIERIVYLGVIAVIVAVAWFVLVPRTASTSEGLLYAFLAVGAAAALRLWFTAAVRRRELKKHLQ
ncbi:hypothetical protein Achl_0453 [Pseudarthrobacter chlorophenolicus A6]|uniref:Uncharacterized protein n=1 Tax=Pseudarthrobacter chlorophenolicus (strain ATCC 700700 / DSM 12829 / CIP 107037 / JCM 12360 / KCTC 9906 / NCIMB 13794 / A6) TaxID=452863 RepID=B8HAJ1_PSECP|nr:hypothetical protein [Pseudarthrobacter chlorophenolicus]ACL38452.1 hypothetical protein Achl_0453 [Pseudarthrobacter chlorophenolicus A6]